MKRGIALITVVMLLGTSVPFAYASVTGPTTAITNVGSNAVNPSTIWIVKSGDSLWKISQNTGVSIAHIVQYNGLANPNSLHVGQMLKIPSIWNVEPGDTLWKIAQATGTSVQSIVQANGIASADQIRVGSTLIIPRGSATYTVQSGDTLWKISQASGMSVQALVQANNLTNQDQLAVGEVLTIHLSIIGNISSTGSTNTGSTPTTSTGSTPTTGLTGVQGSAQLGGATIAGVKWVVGSGDTLASISKAEGVPVAALEVLNGVSTDGQLPVGSVVLIPGGTIAVVQSGNTLYSISQKYGVSVATLEKANQLTDSSILSVGQSIFVPSQEWVTPTQTVPTTGISAPRSDVAVLLPDGAKASLPYTYTDANGMKVTFNFLSHDALNMTIANTNTSPANFCDLLLNTMWNVTGPNQYYEPYASYIDPSFGIQYAGSGHVTGGAQANTGGGVGPGSSVTGSIGFGIFGSANGQFTLHYSLYDTGTGRYDNQQITFLLGSSATGNPTSTASGSGSSGSGTAGNTSSGSNVSAQPSQPTVTVSLAQPSIQAGQTDPVMVSTSPAESVTQATYQVQVLIDGNASTATVDPTSGLFTAQEPGVYLVKATVNGVTSTETQSSKVRVIGPPAIFIFDKSSYQLKSSASPVTMYIEVEDKAQWPLAGQPVTVQSDNPNVVSVGSSSVTTNANGVASIQLAPGSETGTAHITATAGNASAVAPVQVS